VSIRVKLPPRVDSPTSHATDDTLTTRDEEIATKDPPASWIVLSWVLQLLKEELLLILFPAKASSPVAKVCATTELLELILTHLPPIDLIRATIVSKKFEQLILHSPTMHRKTFMLPPKPGTKVHTCEMRLWGKDLDKKALLALKPVKDDLKNYPPPADLERWPEGMDVLRSPPLRIAELCPLLEADYDESLWTGERRATTLSIGPTAMSAPVHFSERMKKGLTIGPWKHMQLSDPPCTSSHVKLYWDCWVAGKKTKVLIAGRHIEDEKGLTMHTLVDDASSTLGKVVVSIPTYDGDEVTSWSNFDLVDTTLFAEMKSGGKPVVGEWFLGMQSRISLDDTVIPAEREQERMLEKKLRNVSPVLKYHLFE
jgi:hypothetical protein